ncbi:MAG: glycosyltransferase family 9 protein, partial [Janthinobacterium lividum]
LSVPWDAQASAILSSSDSTQLRVGIVWAGDPTNERDQIRSVPLSLFAKLFDIDNVRFFSLQVGRGARELDGTEARVTNLGAKFTDMADTAASIKEMDLVISVDTSVAHLAGALGKPVWLLIATVADWRWFTAREDSPWYPSMRIFRQTSFMDWKEVLGRVHTALSDLSTGRR